jgi:hypothetical protein
MAKPFFDLKNLLVTESRPTPEKSPAKLQVPQAHSITLFNNHRPRQLSFFWVSVYFGQVVRSIVQT